MTAARFIGGPWDGRLQAMRAGLPEVLVHTATMRDLMARVAREDDVPSMPVVKHVYRAIGQAHDGAVLMLYWGRA